MAATKGSTIGKRLYNETRLPLHHALTSAVYEHPHADTDNHHHVVCRSCGAVADVDCAIGTAPCLTAPDDQGFAIDEAEVIYWGRCPACSTATKS